MPIQDSDLLLIEDTSGVSKKITASKLKANLAANTYNNHKLLVNKPDYTSRFVYAQNMQASVAPTDYMMVERGGVSYKVNGQQIIDYFPTVPAGAAGAIIDVKGPGLSTISTSTITNVVTAYDWDQSKTWSSQATVFGASASPNATGAFNGDVNTAAAGASKDGNGHYFSWSPNPGLIIPAYTKLIARITTGDQGCKVKATVDGVETIIASTPGFGGTLTNHANIITIVDNTTNKSKVLTNYWMGVDPTGSPSSQTGTAGVYYFNLADILLVDSGIAGAVSIGNLLSFASPNPNYGLFKPGTVVQSEFVENSTQLISNWANLSNISNPELQNNGRDTVTIDAGFDGNSSTAGYLFWHKSIVPGLYNTWECAPWLLIDTGQVFEIKLQIGDQAGTITGYDNLNNVIFEYVKTSSGGGGSSTVTETFTASKPTYFSKIVAGMEGTSGSQTAAFGWYYIKINGKTLINDPAYPPTRVLPSNQEGKMIVDGGAWTGSDGTSSGDAGKRETVVSMQAVYDNQLTLAGTDNLDLFAVGDSINMVNSDGDVASYVPETSTITNVVAEVTGASTSGFASNPVIALFDGSGGGGGTQVYSGDSLTVSLSLSPSFVTLTSNVIRFYASNGSSQSYKKFYVTFTFSDGTSITDSSHQIGPGAELTYTLADSVGKTLTGITWTESRLLNETIYISQLVINGSFLNVADYYDTLLTFESPNPDLKYFQPGDVVQSPDVKVKRTDTAANTLLLDGGDWTGSNGTSSGNAADRETVVTGPARSGTGNFAGNNGPVVDVTNSNQQWIDNTNRLGENFYIKSASTRTGLAVIRNKAIAQAQAWAADSDYVADQFVKHNGRYWLALSSSTNNSPDETDTAQWFDLGAVE